jgi:hypothetical protein
MSATVLTVLRSGAEYRPEHVERLYRQCGDVPFLCLSDVHLDVPHYRMWHSWPGWFSKLEMFRLQGPILYMDLDTTVTGDLRPLLDAAEQYDFVALRNPLPTPSKFGSGLMAWRGDLSSIYHRFLADPEGHMPRCTTAQLWGDQGFISEDCPDPVFWQDLFPGEILSWKVDCNTGIPPQARVVYFHGLPRPWQVGM